jgi:hypothetical protein
LGKCFDQHVGYLKSQGYTKRQMQEKKQFAEYHIIVSLIFSSQRNVFCFSFLLSGLSIFSMFTTIPSPINLLNISRVSVRVMQVTAAKGIILVEIPWREIVHF